MGNVGRAASKDGKRRGRRGKETDAIAGSAALSFVLAKANDASQGLNPLGRNRRV